MAISEWADDVARAVEDLTSRAGRLFEPTLRLGVTGLSRAGKTLFVSSLAANLLRRGRMKGLTAEGEGRIEAVMLSPQPDLDAPRFELERHLSDLYADPPLWPESTRSISQLRLSIRYRPTGLIAQMTGDAFLHLDIVDYPGEWLLDIALPPLSFAEWARQSLERASERAEATAPDDGAANEAKAFLAWVAETATDKTFDEADAQEGARRFTIYLRAAKAAGYSDLTPGRFLLPGDLEGAPALTFAPLAELEKARSGTLGAEMAKRFEAYKRIVVKPFFRDHFSRLDRQVVLADALGAAAAGPVRAADMGRALSAILSSFRPGERSWLFDMMSSTLGWRRIDKLLLAVTRADAIHHTQHGALNALAKDLLAETLDRAAYRGADVEAMAVASVRATVEDEMRAGGESLPAVRGRLLETGETALFYPGEPPRSLAALRRGWEADAVLAPQLAPPLLERREDEGPPHIRLDRAIDFLIGDRLA